MPLRQFTSTTTKIHASQATTKLRYQIDLSGAPLYHRSPSSAERTPQNATSNTRKQQTHDVATWSRTAIFSEGATTTDKHDARTHQQRWSDMYGTWEQIFWGRAMEPHPPQASEVTSDCCDGSSLQFKFLATTLLRPLPAQLRKHARTRTDLPSLTSTSQRQANTHHQRAECIFHNAPAQHTEVRAGAAHRQRRKKGLKTVSSAFLYSAFAAWLPTTYPVLLWFCCFLPRRADEYTRRVRAHTTLSPQALRSASKDFSTSRVLSSGTHR